MARRFDLRSVAGLQYWARAPALPYVFANATPSTTGARTNLLIFQASALPGAGDFSSLGQQIEVGAATGQETLLSALGGAYQPYTFAGGRTDAGEAGVGIADAINTNKHALLWTWDGVLTSDPGGYSALLDGANKTVVASGALGVITANISVLGERRDVNSTESNQLAGTILHAAQWAGVKTAAEIALILAWAATQ